MLRATTLGFLIGVLAIFCILVLLVVPFVAPRAHAQGLMLGMFGTASVGGGGPPPTCTVNLSTKFNDKCSSIFMRR